MDGLLRDTNRFNFSTLSPQKRISPSYILDDRFKFTFDDGRVWLVDTKPDYYVSTPEVIMFTNAGFKEFLQFLQENQIHLGPVGMCDIEKTTSDGIFLSLYREDGCDNLFVERNRITIGIPIESLLKINIKSLYKLCE